ncbi:MAG TPA: AtzG-like protein [Ramlibacter sp.]|uniref:AtzG-like protein n=1 Tax=Ramlibacter sp. TaxID=1917967 RepID=UPI002CBFDA96|nr:AtzG-like protein [Ramlibacter sp.]HVZ47015.1 AtzG-like protein [Ramlibacter sp.]
MEERSLIEYVRAAATLAGIALDDTHVREVALHLSRTAAMARLLESSSSHSSNEPAEIYCPAPFPTEDAP